MERLKSIGGYTWAVLCVLVVFAGFFFNNALEEGLASAAGLRISARMTGGEVVRTLDRGAYTVAIHRPVFDGVLGERKRGFVQVNWKAVTAIPPVLREILDYDGDGRDDFLVEIDTATGRGSLTPYTASVVSLQEVFPLSHGWAVRVNLKKGG